jgi:hypothetical protein
MRLVCLHADTVDALKRLKIEFDDLTPNGLWSSDYHLVGLTAEQMDALDLFNVQAEDITPAQLAAATGGAGQAPAADVQERRPVQQTQPRQGTGGPGAGTSERAAQTGVTPIPTAAPSDAGREATRAAAGNEAEVPLAQTRDGGARPAEARAEAKQEAGKPAAQTPSPQATAQAGGGHPSGPQRSAAGGKGASGVTPPAQGGRKGQPAGAVPTGGQGGQRYGTTRLRISVAGKYTEATVANGKIVVGGRTFDSPDQAAAELTKSRGDWTFWEYYDSADGKWRMLTRDWDTVLKSAAPGGR